jgi:hypothetical protein
MPDTNFNPDIDTGDANAPGHKVGAELDALIKDTPTLRAALGGVAHRFDAEETPPDKKPGSDPKHGVDEDEEGEGGLAKLLKLTTALGETLANLGERLDAIEGKDKKADDEDEEEPRSKRRTAKEERDLPTPVAADSAGGFSFSPKSEVFFADAQKRADDVYSAFGGSAPPPMAGEALMSYRRRLLRPLMAHSPTFKDLDVGVASVDKDLLNKIESAVQKEAIASSRNPLAPNGYLQERKEMRNGHQHTTFHGSPMAWMSRFMPAARAVTKINLRPPTD